MAENFQGAPVSGGDTFAADEVAGVKVPRTKVQIGAPGAAADVSPANPMPVGQAGAWTVSLSPGAEAALVAGTISALAAAINAQLRASALPVSLPGAQAVTGPVTDAQLRAAALPVALDTASLAALESVSLNAGQVVGLDAPSVAALLASRPVTGPLTDAQLRAAPINVSIEGGGAASGPTSTHRAFLANTTNPTSVKAAPGRVYKITINNTLQTIMAFRLYDKASAPTVNVDPLLNAYHLFPGMTLDLDFPGGKPFATGIAYATTHSHTDSAINVLSGYGVMVNIEYA